MVKQVGLLGGCVVGEEEVVDVRQGGGAVVEVVRHEEAVLGDGLTAGVGVWQEG